MPPTTPTILDQISAERTKVSERLARLDTDRATVATQLTDLETAERVLMRVGKTPPGRRPTPAAAAEAKAPTATRGRLGQPPKAATSKAAGRKLSAPSSASASWLWLPARPDRNSTWRAPTIARTISAWRCSAISARDGSRTATANCMRHRPQRSRHTRPPDPGPSGDRRCAHPLRPADLPGSAGYVPMASRPSL